MTIHICTTGTSIASGPRGPIETVQEYEARIDARLRRIRTDETTNKNFLLTASAETNGLVRSGIGPADEVALLVSETSDGQICAAALARLIEREVLCRVQTIVVKGLQVADARIFKTIGVRSLFETLDTLTKERPSNEVVLNVSGGFKGTIPYVVIYGMFHECDVSYVYEFSDAVITLPRLPIEFEWEGLAPAMEVVFTVFREGAILEEQWRALLPYDYWLRQGVYDSLFEFDQGLVTLSAIGHLMKSRLEAAESRAEVWMSPGARQEFESAGPDIQIHFRTMLTRVASPLHRTGAKHSERVAKCDLLVWKVYGSAGPRMLYWTHGERVYVGELFRQHDNYENYIDGRPRNKRDYSTSEFARWEGEREENFDAILTEIRKAADEPRDRIKIFEQEIKSLKIELQNVQAERNRLRKEGHIKSQEAAEHAAAKAEREVRSQLDKAYGNRLRQKEEEIGKLRNAIDRFRVEALRIADDIDFRFEASSKL